MNQYIEDNGNQVSHNPTRMRRIHRLDGAHRPAEVGEVVRVRLVAHVVGHQRGMALHVGGELRTVRLEELAVGENQLYPRALGGVEAFAHLSRVSEGKG